MPRPDWKFFVVLAAAAALILAVRLAAPTRTGELAAFDGPATWPGAETVTLLVDLSDDLNRRERSEILALLPEGTAPNSVHSLREGLYRVALPTADARAVARGLADDPRIEFVEPEYVVALDDDAIPTHPEAEPRATQPNDPLYPFQWHFDQIGVEDGWVRADGSGVVVAVIDTGVAFADAPSGRLRQVRDLSGTEFAPGYDFVDDDDAPFDEHGHGTHVSGTIAQTTNNAYGVAGVAPRVTIMPLRVLDRQGRGSTADIADAIRFAADNGADVINMSLGGPLPSRVMQDAVTYAHRRGVTVIAAAGNSGWSLPSFPAAYRHVVAVSATQYDRTTTFYSNYGRYIDIAAPGGNTRVDQNDDGRPDGVMQETLTRENPAEHEFALYMGTSMASPHTAAVAALVHQLGVSHPDRVAEVLAETASVSVPTYDRDRYGAGLLDAGAAAAYPVTHFQAPRAALAVVLALLGIALAGRNGGARQMSRAAVVTSAVVCTTGLSVLALVAGLLTVPAAGLARLSTSVVQWPAIFGLGSVSTSALAMSAAPVFAVYALFGSVRRRWVAGVVFGAMIGLSAYLIAEAVVPLADVGWVPGAGIVDRLWLGANGAVATIISFIAARRAR